MQRVLRMGVAALGVILLLIGIQEAAFSYFLEARFTEAAGRRSFYLDAFLEDQRLVGAYPFFRARSLGRDASSYLNSRVNWQDGRGRRNLASRLGEKAIGLSDDMTVRIKEWKDWPEGWEAEEAFNKVDLSWMKDLLGYDYWDIEKANPLYAEPFEAVLTMRSAPWNYLSDRPSFSATDFVEMGKLRLIQSLKRGDPMQALREIRHLAELTYSTETDAGELAGIALLGVEQLGYDYFVKMELVRPADWQPIPAEIRQRAKRAAMIMVEYFSVLTPPEIMSRVFDPHAPRVGLCSGIAFGTEITSIFWNNLSAHWPLERDLRARLDGLSRIALEGSGQQCRLEQVKEIWRRAPSRVRAPDGPSLWSFDNLIFRTRYIPYLRQASGAYLAVVGTPTSFNRYDRPVR